MVWRVSRTSDGVGLSDHCRAEGAHGADETYTCVCLWKEIPFPSIHNSLTRLSEFSLAVVLLASTGLDGDGHAFQEECSATCEESYKAKSSATALTSQICHVDGYTYADAGLQFPSCVTTTLSQCSDSTIAQAKSSTRLIART